MPNIALPFSFLPFASCPHASKGHHLITRLRAETLRRFQRSVSVCASFTRDFVISIGEDFEAQSILNFRAAKNQPENRIL
jgi:hypothetical protein